MPATRSRSSARALPCATCRSTAARKLSAAAECYQGGDIKVLAGEFAELNGDKYVAACKGMDEETLFKSEAFAALKDALVTYALPKNIAALKRDLGKYRIDYDVWSMRAPCTSPAR